MSGRRVTILDYGAGNLRSVAKAFEHEGADVALTADPAVAARAERLVLPGQGHFGQCMTRLEETGLADAVGEHVAGGRPFLGICVGMQLLYEASDEDPGGAGLGILPGRVRRLPDGVKRPQMQWNVLELARPDDPIVAGLGHEPWVYWVHSYAADGAGDETVIATCDYGGPVVGVVGRDRLWATQFHPEKSGPVGLRLLRNFVDLAG